MEKNHASASSLFAPDGSRKYLTDSEIRRFLQAAAQAEQHINLLCQVLAHTGCRLSEALQLTGYGVDPERCSLVLLTLKQRKPNMFREVPIPEELMKALIDYMRLGPTCPRLWPVHRQTAYRWIMPVMKDAGLSGVKATSRGLRHGFAVGMSEAGAPMPLIQKWLGHASLKTTAIYMDVVAEHQRNLARKRWACIECCSQK